MISGKNLITKALRYFFVVTRLFLLALIVYELFMINIFEDPLKVLYYVVFFLLIFVTLLIHLSAASNFFNKFFEKKKNAEILMATIFTLSVLGTFLFILTYKK